MRIAVIGATGGTGLEVVRQALATGHAVTALARTPAKIPFSDERLRVITGNVLDDEALHQVINGQDAVVVSLGNRADSREDICSAGTAHVIAVMQQSNVSRLIVVTSLGVGDSKDQVPLPFKLLVATVIRKTMQDKERQEEFVRASNLDWTIVRPGGLTNGPHTGHYRSGLDRDIVAGQISRADVADFILTILNNQMFIRQTPAVT